MATLTDADLPADPAAVADQTRSERNAIGIGDTVVIIVAAAATVTVVPGVAPLATGRGDIGAPRAYLLSSVVLAVFSVGCTAMGRFITNARACYVYLAAGLGGAVDLGAAFLATFSHATVGIASTARDEDAGRRELAGGET